MKQTQFPAILPLSSLDGQYGFKIDGESAGDQSGFQVSGAGDINDDGYADLIIGAPGYSGNSGRSYVIFGGLSMDGGSGLFALSSLNGTNGFKIDSEVIGDYGGVAVGNVGDINGDGYTDLAIGAIDHNAYTGRSYVVFGGPTVSGNGLLALSSLNGANGFKLDGEASGDFSGRTISATGDINVDGYVDLVIGAFQLYNGAVGRSYVVFGGSTVGGNGLLALSSLDGANGFKLDGEASGDYSGFSASACGDVNSDGYADLVIGAFGHNNSAGRSYVVFGRPAISSDGLLALSSLNGTNGFKLDGEGSGDYSGFSVSTAGDINGDGIADLLIGAQQYNISVGRSYVVFGNPMIGGNGLFALSSLNGTNGFKLYGEDNSYSGSSVSIAGDINGDGYTDLVIGAIEYNASAGRTYVVFGGPKLAAAASSGIFSMSALDGVNGFALDGELSGDESGCSVSAAGDVNGDQVDDLLIGAYVYQNSQGRSYVVFGDVPPVITQNDLSLSQGDTVLLNSSFLDAYDLNHANDSIFFVASEVLHGRFELSDQLDTTVSNFTLPQLTAGNVRFVHDGSQQAPSYNITVHSAGIAWTGPDPAAITFMADPSRQHFPAVISLAGLTNQQGFKIDGEAPGDYSSNYAGGIVTDMNADGYFDLFISAVGHNNGTGRSYILFGGPTIGNNGTIALSNLTSSHGFKLEGENSGDWSGISGSATGDMNGDGYTDLVIGAYGYNSYQGRAYVVFGGPKVGGGGSILLSSLDGSDGFKLDGEVSNDHCSWSVNMIEDFNGDGYADILIGAHVHNGGVGRSYVLFGGLGIGSSGLITLASLNGTTGFKIDGEVMSDFSGISVYSAGDVNADGWTDLLMGASGYNGNYTGTGVGRSYVIFGGPGVGSNGLISLAGLNGTNGFKMDGEAAQEISGYSVSTAGDVNGDGIADLLIGGMGYNGGYPNSVGRSYVLFGDVNLGKGGLVSLSNLDGSNGFKLDGEDSNDLSGCVVSAAGDINGDGLSDILIGAYGHNNSVGRSYVIFGSPIVGGSGLVPLSQLDGSNGFKLDGETDGDFSGIVSGAGDINADGIDDLMIGAFGYNSDTGRSYVIFGDAPPILVNNSLTIYSNATVVLDSSYLSAYDRNHDNTTLLFFPTGVMHGQFETMSNPGLALQNFTQQQVQDSQIQFVHDGTDIAPAYAITVRSSGIAWTGPEAAYIIFAPIALGNNQLIVNQGQTVRLTSENLNAFYAGALKGDLDFLISDLQQGRFELVSMTGQPIFTFKQQNITDGDVQFVHDGSINPPDYRVAVSTEGVTTVPQAATIDFDASPILVNNTLVINQGQTVRLTANMLSATHPGGDDSELLFIVSNVAQGQFSQVDRPDQSIFDFYQQNITDRLVQFSHDNSPLSPSYQVSVSDGRITTSPAPALIDFDQRPILMNNTITIGQNQTVTLTSAQLLATHNGVVDPSLLFHITNVTHATFSEGLTFSQQAVLDGAVSVIQDGSLSAPGYAVTVDDGRMQTEPAVCAVTFYKKPVISTNQLFTQVGASTLLTTDNLCADNCTETTSDSLLFTLGSTPQYGQFELVNNPGKSITSFSQKQVKQGTIQFTPDGTPQAPLYQLIAADPQSQLTSEVSAGDTLLLVANDWPINQGEVFKVTSDALNTASSKEGEEDILYTPIIGTVAQGYFAFSSQPNTSIPSFSQNQVMLNQVVFVPDGSTVAPSAVLSITDASSSAHGSFSCAIDFATPPRLSKPFLKIDPPDRIVLTTANLQAYDDQGRPPSELVFQVSEVKNDHFAYIADWDTPIFNFTQQDINTGKIAFIAETDQPPAFMVSVSNGRLTCQGCPVPAQVVAPDAPTSTPVVLRDWWMFLLTAFILPLGKWGLEKALKHHFGHLEQKTIQQQVTAAVLGQLWIGVCSLVTRRQYNDYVSEIGEVIQQIEVKEEGGGSVKISDKWGRDQGYRSEREKEKVASIIAREAKKVLLEDRFCASNRYGRFFTSFCRSEATPEMIRGKSAKIAQNAQEELNALIRGEKKDDSLELKESNFFQSAGEPLLSHQLTHDQGYQSVQKSETNQSTSGSLSNPSLISLFSPVDQPTTLDFLGTSSTMEDEKALTRIKTIRESLDRVYPSSASDNLEIRNKYLKKLAKYEKKARQKLLTTEERSQLAKLETELTAQLPVSYTK